MKIGLTDCEEIVMNTIWLMESKGEKHITLPMILLEVNLQHKKEWKPPTVSAFFARLVQKGVLDMRREGRLFCYRSIQSKEDYITSLFTKYTEFLFDGDVRKFKEAVQKWIPKEDVGLCKPEQ